MYFLLVSRGSSCCCPGDDARMPVCRIGGRGSGWEQRGAAGPSAGVAESVEMATTHHGLAQGVKLRVAPPDKVQLARLVAHLNQIGIVLAAGISGGGMGGEGGGGGECGCKGCAICSWL